MQSICVAVLSPVMKVRAEAGRERRSLDGRSLSINIELPTVQGLHALPPEKDSAAITRSMARLRTHIDDAKARRAEYAKTSIISLPKPLTRPLAR